MSEVVAVLGAGTMGQGISQVVAQAGHDVVLYDPFPAALQRARSQLQDVLIMLQRKGRLARAADVLARIAFTQDLQEVRGAAWVLEAVPEDLDLKLELYRTLGELAPGAVLASNTSTFSISRLAAASGRPADVLGMHFFNPAPLMKLVEIIPGQETPASLTDRAARFARDLGKEPVIARDAPGFLVNRVARPYYGEALELHGQGAPPEDLDAVLRGMGFRMGPFELMDLIGIDVNYAATQSVYQGFFADSRFRPHPLQRRLVDAGRLGRKTGAGFYRYPRPGTASAALPAQPDEACPSHLLGSGPLAEALAERLNTVPDPGQAELILDLRVPLDAKRLPPDAAGKSVLSLTWGHSASLAVPRYPSASAVAGIGLVPPLTGTSVIELYAPVSGENRATELARRNFRAHGLPTVTLPDQPGGAGFRILAMLVNEAVSALAEGLAAAADIDRALCLGLNYPRGPLAWSETLGLAAALDALEGIHRELGEARYRPHPLWRRAVAAGLTRWSEL